MKLRPLSPALYFWRNKTRALPVLGIIALSVLGVLLVGILADTMLNNFRQNFVGPSAIFARIYARKESLPPNIAAVLRHHPDVERVIPGLRASVHVQGLQGSEGNPVIAVAPGDLDYFMDKVSLHLAEGRLPVGSRREIALHDEAMRNKGLKIGDQVGRDLDLNEYLPAKFTVVGKLEGPFSMSVVPLAALREIYGQSGDTSLFVFPKPGRMRPVDGYLSQLDSDKVATETATTMARRYESETGNINIILWAINGVTMIVLSLAVGLLNNIYFIQRLGEFGILSAIGYPTGFLIRRTLIEATILSVVGWLLGLGLASVGAEIIRVWLFNPRGMTLVNLSSRTIVFTVPIPVLTGAFSLVTVIRRLRALDPVSIVERRD
ncbi:MAG TPA: ABC transporter permease [Symbiobacteriaceae bacterium]|jgi:putative ABC transport system permease protein